MRLHSVAAVALLTFTVVALLLARPALSDGDDGEADAAPPPAARKVATTYGADRFADVTKLAFTFNVLKPDGSGASRRWVWEPGADRVTVGEGEDAVSYSRDSITDERKSTDAKFINDQYWLLFPLHLAWDDVVITDDGAKELPVGDGDARRLTVTYPAEGGYTPGDVYELFVGDDHRLVAWNYRRGGGAEGRAMTWDDHKQAGPLLLSLSHYTADRKFRVWFTDVEVHTADGQVAKVTASE